MIRHAGQAVKDLGVTLHRVSHALLMLVLLLTIGTAGLAWRLARGPLDLDLLKDRIEAGLNRGLEPAHVSFSGVSIAWDGFSQGLNQPLILRVRDVKIDAAAGGSRVVMPLVEAGLSFRGLLMGRLLPRTITLEGAAFTMTRTADGAVSIDLGSAKQEQNGNAVAPLSALLAVLGEPPGSDLQLGMPMLTQLSAVSIRGATLTVDDRALAMTWAAQRLDVDLSRHPGGGVDGSGQVILVLGGEKANLTGTFSVPRASLSKSAGSKDADSKGAGSIQVAARLSQVTPKALAAAAPVFAPLAALDAPVTLDVSADLGPDLVPLRLRAAARAGAGKISAGLGTVPIRRAEFTLSGTPEQMKLESAVIEAQPKAGGAVTSMRAGGQLTHRGGRLGAVLDLTLDRVAFADLRFLWPAGIARNARDWITQNITGGVARDGKAVVTLDGRDDGSDLTLVRASGTLEGDDITATWLPTVPPIEQGKARLVLTDPDKIEIEVRTAQQKVRGGDPIAIRDGRVIVTGLAKTDQIATIRCDVTGSVASAIALLKEPRMRILDRHPLDLRAPAGEARLSFSAVLPLELKLDIDDITIRATGPVTGLHLGGIAAGRDLDDGALTIDVDTTRLLAKGKVRLGGIPTDIDAMMDFRSGPPSQLTQRYIVSGKATPAMLTAAGLDTGGVVSGEASLTATLNEYRNGTGEILIGADLTRTAVSVPPLAWVKAEGSAVKASARLILAKDKMTGIDRITADGPGVTIRATIAAPGGRIEQIRLERAILGRTDVSGTIRLPRDGSVGLDLSGPALDLNAKILEKPMRNAPPGPAWSLRGQFDRVLLAHDEQITRVAVSADHDGTLTRNLALSATSGGGKPIAMSIGRSTGERAQPVRQLAMTANDAGRLLRGLDITPTVQNGVLTITGAFDDATPAHVLTGTLEIDEFRVMRAAALGKLLQGLTLYGLFDALDGPGLSFSRLVAPFQLTDDTVLLHDTRAFSPSLGVTVKGRIDRGAGRMDVEGTVVPAYVFNSLLGKIPLIGALFRSEQGGGLIAMNYALRGPVDDPSVMANPLSALTPGILRGMFGLFDGPADQSGLDRTPRGGDGSGR